MRFVICFLSFLSCVLGDVVDLSLYEKSIYSSHGEDGVISKIFQLIQPSSRYCVEFGAYDGISGSNTHLLRRQGWSSLLLDRLLEIPEYNLHKEFIRADNINLLLDQYKVPADLDLLSISLDYNDFYIWKAVDDKFRPKVVVIACNPMHAAEEDKVVQYRAFFCGEGTDYYGASVLALYNLGRSKGYSLVYHDSTGNKLFFIEDSWIAKEGLQFKNVNEVEKLYQKSSGEPRRKDPKQRKYISSFEILNAK